VICAILRICPIEYPSIRVFFTHRYFKFGVIGLIPIKNGTTSFGADVYSPLFIFQPIASSVILSILNDLVSQA
jgi:hypothetical protein